jgi:hypothetical protein
VAIVDGTAVTAIADLGVTAAIAIAARAVIVVTAAIVVPAVTRKAEAKADASPNSRLHSSRGTRRNNHRFRWKGGNRRVLRKRKASRAIAGPFSWSERRGRSIGSEQRRVAGDFEVRLF